MATPLYSNRSAVAPLPVNIWSRGFQVLPPGDFVGQSYDVVDGLVAVRPAAAACAPLWPGDIWLFQGVTYTVASIQLYGSGTVPTATIGPQAGPDAVTFTTGAVASVASLLKSGARLHAASPIANPYTQQFIVLTGSIVEVTMSGVTSVFGRNGDVVATAGDYTVALVTGALAANGSGSSLTGITGAQISGNIAGNAAGITGSITTAQVSNLSSWAGSTSITTLGTIATGTIPGANVSGNITGSAGGLTASIAESQVTGLVTDLAAKSPLAGSTSITTLGTIATGTIPQANVSGLGTSLAALAPLASPTFTGSVTLPAGTVTLAEHASLAASSLMGNPTGSPASPSAITLGANLSFSGGALVGTAGGSVNVVYASKISGIHLNGTTDDTALIQTVLDAHGTAGTPLRLVMDGMSAINTLYVWSGQHLDGIAGLGGFVKLSAANGANGLLAITNKHWVLGTTTPGGTDQHITLSNLYVDGSRRNGGCGVTYPNGGHPQMNASYCIVPTIGFYGLSFLRVDNVHVYDSTSYSLNLANVVHATVTGFSGFGAASDTYAANNPIQLEGWCDDCRFFGVAGSCNDDPWAFNANDGNDRTGAGTSQSNPTFTAGTVVQGPITNCEINGGSFYNLNSSGGYGITCGRFLSSNPSSYINNVTVKNVVVTGATEPMSFDNIGIPLGTGAYDNIIIENYKATTAASVPCVFIGNATCGSVIIKDMRVVPTAAVTSSAGAIDLTSGSTVASLRVSGLDYEDASGLATVAPVLLAGTATDVRFLNTTINRGTTQLAAPAISCTGTVAKLQISGGIYSYVNNVVGVSAGTTSFVQASDIAHAHAGGSATFAQTGGTFTYLLSSNMSLGNAGVGHDRHDQQRDRLELCTE